MPSMINRNAIVFINFYRICSRLVYKKSNFEYLLSLFIGGEKYLLFSCCFQAVDKDHSGFISLNEYKLFFKCLGLTPEDAAVSFAVIDKNGDGKLSIKEFVKLGREFFLTEDEKRVSRMFWGPLVNDH